MKYIIDTKKKRQFMMAFLLDQLIDKRDFNVVLTDNDEVLEDLFVEMLSIDFVKISGNQYVIGTKGQEFMNNFFQKFGEFLKFYDIFCAIDLANGTFAFSKFFDFETDDEWLAYLNQPGWDDVRVAVCEFKKIDPIEVVFMSFLSEGRFTTDNWQFDLVSDLIWDEILEICETAIPLSDLSENGVITNIVTQGATIMMDILKEENKRKLEEMKEAEDEGYEEEVIYVEEEVVYYEPYVYDPFYISPCWVWYY